ncbi:hypothetical protein [Limnohabitans sp. Hippo3]|uniref:hypothetical protein n=1 Tax=Limnohabitans sp. Hippo3 TaxID=1597956 RepID=UPI000D3989CB|nr:hypothetical protein [Limnohabitans sp. Hippo3]PUE38612.1 hypothetical protein B9Z34_11505 [Limnohabitans sp. Hippo3]
MSKTVAKTNPQVNIERLLHTAPQPEKRASAKQDPRKKHEEDTQVVSDADAPQGDDMVVAAAPAASEAPMVLAQASTAAAETSTAAAGAAAAPAVSGWVIGLAALGGLALAANSGSSSAATPTSPTTPNSSVSGTAIDGYLIGAKVYLIAPDGTKIDTGVTTSTETGQEGRFTIQNPNNYVIQIEGGVNADTGLENTVVLKAPATTNGSIVVTPLTSMIQALVENNTSMTLSQAESAVKLALGIDPDNSISLTTYDPISAGKEADQAIAEIGVAVQKAAASVAALIVQAQASASGDPGKMESIGAAVLQSLINEVITITVDPNNVTPLSLTNPGTVTTLLTAAAAQITDNSLQASLSGVIATVVSKVVETNILISLASNLDNIANAQKTTIASPTSAVWKLNNNIDISAKSTASLENLLLGKTGGMDLNGKTLTLNLIQANNLIDILVNTNNGQMIVVGNVAELSQANISNSNIPITVNGDSVQASYIVIDSAEQILSANTDILSGAISIKLSGNAIVTEAEKAVLLALPNFDANEYEFILPSIFTLLEDTDFSTADNALLLSDATGIDLNGFDATITLAQANGLQDFIIGDASLTIIDASNTPVLQTVNYPNWEETDIKLLANVDFTNQATFMVNANFSFRYEYVWLDLNGHKATLSIGQYEDYIERTWDSSGNGKIQVALSDDYTRSSSISFGGIEVIVDLNGYQLIVESYSYLSIIDSSDEKSGTAILVNSVDYIADIFGVWTSDYSELLNEPPVLLGGFTGYILKDSAGNIGQAKSALLDVASGVTLTVGGNISLETLSMLLSFGSNFDLNGQSIAIEDTGANFKNFLVNKTLPDWISALMIEGGELSVADVQTLIALNGQLNLDADAFLFSYSLKDTLANLAAAPNDIFANYVEYAINDPIASEGPGPFEDKLVSEILTANELQLLLGANNYLDYPHSLKDTLENFMAGVTEIEGFNDYLVQVDYYLTDTIFHAEAINSNLSDLIFNINEAQAGYFSSDIKDIAYRASNSSDITINVPFTIVDTGENILAAYNAGELPDNALGYKLSADAFVTEAEKAVLLALPNFDANEYEFILPSIFTLLEDTDFSTADNALLLSGATGIDLNGFDATITLAQANGLQDFIIGDASLTIVDASGNPVLQTVNDPYEYQETDIRLLADVNFDADATFLLNANFTFKYADFYIDINGFKATFSTALTDTFNEQYVAWYWYWDGSSGGEVQLVLSGDTDYSGEDLYLVKAFDLNGHQLIIDGTAYNNFVLTDSSTEQTGSIYLSIGAEDVRSSWNESNSTITLPDDVTGYVISDFPNLLDTLTQDQLGGAVAVRLTGWGEISLATTAFLLELDNKFQANGKLAGIKDTAANIIDHFANSDAFLPTWIRAVTVSGNEITVTEARELAALQADGKFGSSEIYWPDYHLLGTLAELLAANDIRDNFGGWMLTETVFTTDAIESDIEGLAAARNAVQSSFFNNDEAYTIAQAGNGGSVSVEVPFIIVDTAANLLTAYNNDTLPSGALGFKLSGDATLSALQNTQFQALLVQLGEKFDEAGFTISVSTAFGVAFDESSGILMIENDDGNPVTVQIDPVIGTMTFSCDGQTVEAPLGEINKTTPWGDELFDFTGVDLQLQEGQKLLLPGSAYNIIYGLNVSGNGAIEFQNMDTSRYYWQDQDDAGEVIVATTVQRTFTLLDTWANLNEEYSLTERSSSFSLLVDGDYLATTISDQLGQDVDLLSLPNFSGLIRLQQTTNFDENWGQIWPELNTYIKTLDLNGCQASLLDLQLAQLQIIDSAGGGVISLYVDSVTANLTLTESLFAYLANIESLSGSVVPFKVTTDDGTTDLFELTLNESGHTLTILHDGVDLSAYDSVLYSYLYMNNYPVGTAALDLNGQSVKISYGQYTGLIQDDGTGEWVDADDDGYGEYTIPNWTAGITNTGSGNPTVTVVVGASDSFSSPLPPSTYLAGIEVRAQVRYAGGLDDDGIVDELDGVTTSGEWNWDPSTHQLSWWSDAWGENSARNTVQLDASVNNVTLYSDKYAFVIT